MNSAYTLRNPFDYRDIPVSAAVNIPDTTLTKYRNSRIDSIPVRNQNPQPACVGHGEVLVKGHDDLVETGTFEQLSERAVYSCSKLIDGNPPETAGTYPRATAKVLQTIGVPSDKLVPNNVWLPLAEYRSYVMTPEASVDASKHKVSAYGTIPAISQQIKNVLALDKLISITLTCNSDWNLPIIAKPKSPIDALHRVVLCGFEEVDGDIIFEFRNSWGDQWGDKGNGKFRWSEYQNDIFDIMTYVDAPTKLIEDAKAKPAIFSYNWTKTLTISTYGVNYRVDIVALQTALKIKGLFYRVVKDDLEPTGVFGEMTLKAVKRYQASKGIDQTGNVGNLTRAALNKEFEKVGAQEVSEAGIGLLMLNEGCKLQPYQDSVGIWTIGYGNTYFNGVKVTQSTPAITIEQAKAELKKVSMVHAITLLAKCTRGLKQCELDALTSLSYNLGSIPATFIAKVNNGTITREDFLQYVYAGGKLLEGLRTRRGREADYYFS